MYPISSSQDDAQQCLAKANDSESLQRKLVRVVQRATNS